MKAHIGVDAASGLVHTVIATAGNVADVTQAHALLHGQETIAMGDAGKARAFEGKRTGEGGTPVSRHQQHVSSLQDALPRPGEKYCATVHAVWLGQFSVDR